MRLTACIGLLSLAVLGSCGDPFTQPACYSGPGCGEDDVPPVGEITSPDGGSQVHGNFFVNVIATDNIGILGVEFFEMDFPIGKMVTKPPYRMLIDPTFIQPNPGTAPGPRDITVYVHDVAGNVDSLYLTVYYSP
jgi:hypothetical protein